MEFRRRSLLMAAGATLLSACARPEKAQAQQLNDWKDFKARFLKPEGRIVDIENGGISHSEGQGYGMVLAAAVGDRPAFDALYRWTEANLARDDMALYSWRYSPNAAVAVADRNNATDGDILIAWALMWAERQWQEPDYGARAAAIRHAIGQNLVRDRGALTVLLPGLQGFDTKEHLTLNPAYYVWPALDLFRAVDGDAVWGKLVRDGEKLMKRARFGPSSLPTDWIDLDIAGAVTPAAGRPARFGFDAVRLPLYLLLGGRVRLADGIVRYWKGFVSQKRSIPAWVDVRTGEVAPYALSPGAYAIAGRVLGAPKLAGAAAVGPDNYYSRVLGLLAQLDVRSVR